MTDDIFVTKPSMPPLEAFVPHLETIWRSGILSNCGPFHSQLEARLAEYLGVPHISLFNNGTIALVTALQALAGKGEVITTPFSFVATSHAVRWNRQVPVFVDVEPGNLNMDPAKVEAAITPRTTAILPVHCYGNPARTAELEEIAKRHDLKLVYDASHAFGVRDTGGSILRHGDMSTLSLHATKVFNTFEGGVIVSGSASEKDMIDRLKNFGHDGEASVVATGINGKMSEINCAFGLIQLDHIDTAIARRCAIATAYRQAIDRIEGLDYIDPALGGPTPNNAYFPVLVRPGYLMSRDELYHSMKARGVHPRRYFYPLITAFAMYHDLPSAAPSNLPVAHRAAQEVLCLPIYPDLSDAQVERIVSLLHPS